jgi:hypothetical protein
MSQCPRQWQLARSGFADLAGYPERPSEATEVGTIVHDLLSKLFHAMAVAGHPPLGSKVFQDAVARVNLLGTARSRLDEFAQGAARNPRALGFRREATPRDVYNKVAAAFRDEYARVVAQAFAPIPPLDEGTRASAPQTPVERRVLLERNGVLSEEAVRHPTLPLIGFIDLLVRRRGGTTVLDFKTGESRPEYRSQLLMYAMMWWRSTGDLPVGIELRYGARVESWPVTAEELVQVEREVEEKIGRFGVELTGQPAAATVGPHCAGCGVRQLCEDYWRRLGETGSPTRAGERVDVAVVTRGDGTKTGFGGTDGKGRDLTVVFEEDAGALFGPFLGGRKLRVLGATREAAEETTLRLGRGAEVFHVE